MTAAVATPRTVSIAGVSDVTISLAPEATVRDALLEAASTVGLNLSPEKFDVLVDADDANLDDPIGNAEVVEAAAPLANG